MEKSPPAIRFLNGTLPHTRRLICEWRAMGAEVRQRPNARARQRILASVAGRYRPNAPVLVLHSLTSRGPKSFAPRKVALAEREPTMKNQQRCPSRRDLQPAHNRR